MKLRVHLWRGCRTCPWNTRRECCLTFVSPAESWHWAAMQSTCWPTVDCFPCWLSSGMCSPLWRSSAAGVATGSPWRFSRLRQRGRQWWDCCFYCDRAWDAIAAGSKFSKGIFESRPTPCAVSWEVACCPLRRFGVIWSRWWGFRGLTLFGISFKNNCYDIANIFEEST